MQVELSSQELEVIINALNYAKGEWAMLGDDVLSDWSDRAEALEARLTSEPAQAASGG